MEWVGLLVPKAGKHPLKNFKGLWPDVSAEHLDRAQRLAIDSIHVQLTRMCSCVFEVSP